MTLPANDAFTLGLTGNHDSSRPTYSSGLSLRPTSPKIPFVSTTKSPVAYTSSPTNKVAKTKRRSMSNGVANGGADAHHDTKASGESEPPSTHLPPSLSPRATHHRNASVRSQATVNAARIDWEIPRKTLHSSIGFLTLYLYYSHGSPHTVVVALSMALIIIIPTDILRLNHTGFEQLYERCLGSLMRESEKKSSNGVIWYMLGAIFVLYFYPLDIAVVSILILSWADTAASTIGRWWGSKTPRLPRRLPILGLPLAPRKSVAGFIAGSITGAAIAAGFWGWIAPAGNVPPTWTWSEGPSSSLQMSAGGVLTGWTGLGLVAVVSGIVSGVAEALDVGSLDDNLTLPIISGGCIWGFLKFLDFLSS